MSSPCDINYLKVGVLRRWKNAKMSYFSSSSFHTLVQLDFLPTRIVLSTALILLSLSFGVFTPLQCSSSLELWNDGAERWHEMKFTFSLIVIESSRDARSDSQNESQQWGGMKTSHNFFITFSSSSSLLSPLRNFLRSMIFSLHSPSPSTQHMAIFFSFQAESEYIETVWLAAERKKLFTFSSSRAATGSGMLQPSSAHTTRDNGDVPEWKTRAAAANGHGFFSLCCSSTPSTLYVSCMSTGFAGEMSCLSLSCLTLLPLSRARHSRSHFHDFMIFSIIFFFGCSFHQSEERTSRVKTGDSQPQQQQ